MVYLIGVGELSTGGGAASVPGRAQHMHAFSEALPSPNPPVCRGEDFGRAGLETPVVDGPYPSDEA